MSKTKHYKQTKLQICGLGITAKNMIGTERSNFLVVDLGFALSGLQ